MKGTIKEMSLLSGVPAGTIRRWLAEGRLVRHGDSKPYRVSYDEILQLRDTLSPRLRKATE